MKTKLLEVNKGWESYYSSTKQEDLWKDKEEAFLLENYATMTQKDHYSVIDIGCGDGRNSLVWIKDTKANLCCLDVAKSGLMRIKEKCYKQNLKSPTLVCDDLLETKILEENFDIVQCFDALAQINDAKLAIEKLCELAKVDGYIIFNYFTPGDCAYGEGEQIDKSTFTYKDTLFKFLSIDEIIKLIPKNVEIISSETRRWEDPPHGEYRPYCHTHEAAFFLLKRNS